MRNLQKLLALVLALVMSFALVSVAGAKDFNDVADDNDYIEAIDVISTVGIINGKGGNNYDPDGTLTREEAAKIVTYMLLGQAAADKLTTTVAPYADVAAGRWSAGSIAYCTNEEILAGVGGGKFDPTGSLTGLQFAKMLLVALGYDAGIEKLTGASWAINVAKLTVSGDTGLDDELEDVALSQPISRAQAAQMALNAIKAPLVEYYGDDIGISVGGADINISDKTRQFVTSTIAESQNISDKTLSNNDDAYIVEFGERYLPDLVLDDDEQDAFLRPAYEWSYKDEVIDKYGKEPTYVYHSDFDEDALKKIQKTYDTTDAEVHYNGQETANKDITLDGNAKTGIYNTDGKAVTGYNVEIYTDNVKDEITKKTTRVVTDVIVYELYFAKVGKLTAAKGSTPAKIELTVYNYDADNGGTNTDGKKVTYSDDEDSTTDAYDVLSAYEKDTYIGVYMHTGWDTVGKDKSDWMLGVVDLETVSGSVTRVTAKDKINQSTIAVDGATYKINNMQKGVFAKTTGTSEANDRLVKAGDKGTLYLDDHGNVLGYVAESSSGSANVIAVTSYYQVLENSKIVNKVDGVAANGETITLTLSSKEDKTAPALENKVFLYVEDDNNKGTYILVDQDGNTYNGTDSRDTNEFKKFVTLAGIANAKGGDVVYAETHTTDIKKNAKVYDTTNKIYFSSSTKFIYVDSVDTKGSSVGVTVVDGVQEFTADDVPVYIAIEEIGGEKYAVAVYVVSDYSGTVSNTDDIIFVHEANGTTMSIEDESGKYSVTGYKAYINGEEVDDFYSTTNNAKTGFYKYERNDKTGAYTLAENPNYTAETGTTAATAAAGVTVASYSSSTGILIAKTSNTVYDLSNATIVDLTEEDGLVADKIVHMIFDSDTMEVSYAYVVDPAD